MGLTILTLILRLIHIFGGVFWVGASIFMIRFVVPTVSEAGAEGGRFMQRLVRDRRVSQAIAIGGGLTVLSGLLLYGRYAFVNTGWITTKYGITLAVGGLFGIIALAHGGAVMGRASTRMAELGQSMQAAGGPPTPEQVKEMQALQETLQRHGVWSMVLMSVALICMSIAQVL